MMLYFVVLNRPYVAAGHMVQNSKIVGEQKNVPDSKTKNN